ncbi:MAG: exodeoxyribonuclease V subunit gamma, partial [Candidatus Hydrogenedentes bacterium]|nr:exodeoxyribonuclease V subunit gamma [Candidatus Hydrogenedentota bacterium]
MADVFLIAGTLGSGRVARIDGLLHEAWGHAWLLVPTRQYASRRIERLLLESDLGGAWGRPVSTMEDFVVALLRAEGLQPTRLNDFERRMLLKRVLDRLEAQGALEPLGPAMRTNGFATHVLRTITQLKQAAIEPAVFAERIARRKHAAPIDGVVAAIYAGYQDALRDTGAYDLPGLFWAADVVAQAKCPAALDGIETLLLDGFDDFTPSEFRLLASIETHVDRLVFGVDYDADPDRRDLFALPYRTIQALQKRFAVRIETYEADAPQTCIEFASRHFMHRGTPPAPANLVRDAGFWICSDFTQEMETVARRVKTLLLEGVSADAIAVVYPDLRHAAPTIRTVFVEFGVPIRLIHPPALWSSAISGFLLALLAALDAWNHSAVLDVLMSPWFQGGTPESDSFARLAAMAQVVAGRSEWFQGVERLLARIEAKKSDDITRLIDTVPNAEAGLRLLQTRLAELGRLADHALERAAPSAWPAWLDDAIDELAIPETVERHPVEAIRDYERVALATLRDLLGRWAAWSEPDERPETRADFVAALRHALQQTPFPAPGARNGIAVLDLASLRGLQFDYVFLAGANEGDIPSPPPANAVYSEQDVSELAELGVELEGRRVHAEREALLFHRVFDAARKHLIISWRVYARGGKEQSPSPYADEVRALLEPATGPPLARDRFVPDAGEAASWRDICNLASEGVSALKAVVARCFPRIETGARIERARHDKTPFGAHDGVLSHAGVAERYGLNHVFSVAQLETYADCPFRFFVERILDIEESERPKAEFDPRVRGQI